MSNNPIKVLLIEDSKTVAAFLAAELAGETSFDDREIVVTVATTFNSGLANLEVQHFDALLLDLTLPDSTGIGSVMALRIKFPDLPIIVLTGTDDKHLALQAIKAGAEDYLIKGVPGANAVGRSIRYAIERKANEKDLVRLQLLEQRENFIAMLAHDLRNPLIGSQRLLSYLLEEGAGPLNAMQEEYLSMVEKSNESVLRMIKKVLSSYRLENGQEEMHIIDVNLAEILMEVVDHMRPQAEEKGIKFTGHVSPNVLVQADLMAMKRVIDNILGNAIKFTEPGGIINLSVRSETNCGLLAISDTGKGIAKENLDRAFMPFFQCSEPSRNHGFGLGLYICKQLIDLQGGDIDCRSTEGLGTTFTMALPLAEIVQLPFSNGNSSKFRASA